MALSVSGTYIDFVCCIYVVISVQIFQVHIWRYCVRWPVIHLSYRNLRNQWFKLGSLISMPKDGFERFNWKWGLYLMMEVIVMSRKQQTWLRILMDFYVGSISTSHRNGGIYILSSCEVSYPEKKPNFRLC